MGLGETTELGKRKSILKGTLREVTNTQGEDQSCLTVRWELHKERLPFVLISVHFVQCFMQLN